MGNGKFSRPFPKLVTPKTGVLGLFVAPPRLFGIVSSQQVPKAACAGEQPCRAQGAGAAPKAPLAAERGNGAAVSHLSVMLGQRQKIKIIKAIIKQ